MKRVSVLMLAAVMVLVCAVSGFVAFSQKAYDKPEKRAKQIADSLHSLAESIVKHNKHADGNIEIVLTTLSRVWAKDNTIVIGCAFEHEENFFAGSH